ncbi:uncharacterized protein LOC130623492 [Hydractinia symbiolongicarpus]|uniref:uncharacterized protein LOC130623492 n=1 Tax=Hydractinia symbiolongicarpus TaxID=13093 RepID=UPI00254F6202|nr:uncharacterized protein LOC130623492 [Hydractinia symbiolongicarpus]
MSTENTNEGYDELKGEKDKENKKASQSNQREETLDHVDALVTKTAESKMDLLQDDNENIHDKQCDSEAATSGSLTENKMKTDNVLNSNECEDWTLETKLNSFLKWCKENDLKLSSKVKVDFVGTSHRYGMVATKDIKKGETLFVIPRTVLLHSDNGKIADRIVDYEDWLDDIGRSLDDSSGWIPLLLTLMFEYNIKNSFWAPYLRLMPEAKEFGHPLFWTTEDQIANLSGMSLFYDIQRDIINMEHEYNQFVLPFLCRNKGICPNVADYSLDLYKRVVAFVMAYSFTEGPGSTSMIPMADILNHHSDNNAHLIFEEDCLKMKSFKKIEKGEEIFNTFGKLDNSALLQMYGYVEPNNQYESVSVAVISFLNVIGATGKLSPSYLQAMTAFLDKTLIAPSDDFFIFDKNGMRNGPDLIHALKVWHMSENEFEDMVRARACNRPDSFYKKLLRKLKLAKKTDVSSGVAVIDITEEELECEQEGEKRKFVELQEIEEDAEEEQQQNKRLHLQNNGCCYHDVGISSHVGTCNNVLDKACGGILHNIPNKLMDYNNRHHQTDHDTNSHVGNTKSSAIVIDDDSEDDVEKTQSDKKHIDKTDRDEKVDIKESNNKMEVDILPNNNLSCSVSKTEELVKTTGSENNLPLKQCEDGTSENKISGNSKNNEHSDESADKTEPVTNNVDNLTGDENINCAQGELKDTEINVCVSSEEKSNSPQEQDIKCATNCGDKTISTNTNVADESSERSCKISKSAELNTNSEASKNSMTNEPNLCNGADVRSSCVGNDAGKNSTFKVTVKETALCADKTSHNVSVENEEKSEDENEELLDSDVDSDTDEIEFVGEDITCAMTYENLNKKLLPEWRDTVKKVLEKQLTNLNAYAKDNNPKESMTRDQLNAYEVRCGQRSVLNTFMAALT